MMHLHHIGLAVRDLGRAMAFYRAAAGFEPAAECVGSAPAALLRAPNCYLELIITAAAADATPRPVNEAGITHFCVQGRQMDALHTRFADAGASFHAPPVGLGTGNLYAYARDPELNVVELEALPYAPPAQAPWVAHVAIATPDVERLAAFYHRLLGGNRVGGQKIGPSPLYDQVTGLPAVEVIPTWIAGGNVTVELWQYLNPPTLPAAPRPFEVPGFNHICFEVESAAEAIAACVEAGATVDPPVAHSATLVRDPDGNLLELRETADCAARDLAGYTIVAQVAAMR